MTWRTACLAVAFALMGCADEAGTDPAGPVEFVDLRIEQLAPTRAVVRFATSRPTSCEAQYGLDPDALDLSATDPSMAPGQLVLDHEVPLEDLLPSSNYAWRARATDAEGRTYLSELQSFLTPAAIEGDELTNVALASAGTFVAGRSSTWADGPDDGPFGPLNAIDGKMTTEWSSNGDGDDAWIELDLGQRRELVALGFRSRMMTDGSSIVTSVDVVLDDETRLGPFATPDHTQVYRFDFPEATPAQRARVEVRSSTGGNTGAREVQLFAAP